MFHSATRFQTPQMIVLRWYCESINKVTVSLIQSMASMLGISNTHAADLHQQPSSHQSPAAISLSPMHACTPSPSFLISLIIPHQNEGGGGCHFYRGLSPAPKHTHTHCSCISAFFLLWIVLIYYHLTCRTNEIFETGDSRAADV